MSVVDLVEVRGAKSEARPSPAVERLRPTRPPCSSYFRWKHVPDTVLAVLLLIPGLPLIGLLVLLVRWTSRGAGIYRQVRVGKDGRNFTMYKIRTMRHDAEVATGAVWTQTKDARVTALGRVLRKLHLDELPQLFNVLRGEMSLVGPRPERPEFVRVLAERVPGYLDRLAVAPGITGLAQINLEPDTDLESVPCKLVLDREYLQTAGAWMDFRIFLSTLLHLLGISGERSRRIVRLHRTVRRADTAMTEASLTPATITEQRAPAPFNPTFAHLADNRLQDDCAEVFAESLDLVNAFTVDVEDYFHVSAFEKDIPRHQWSRFLPRIEQNTHRILELLDRHDVRATFFVLGWVADRHPQLVREIHDAGHEIGSHGYWHRLAYHQAVDEFRADVTRSRDVLADLIGEPIRAYRAPSFSITKQSLWALDVLAEEGFTVDSSVFPIYHDRYGIPGAKSGIHRLETSAGSLWEFPPSVVRLGRMRLPIGGGGYFRLYPLSWTLRGLARIHRTSRQPFMFYVHPWEVDPQQPRLRAGSTASRFRHRVNLAKTEGRLDVLLGTFRFGRLCDVIGRFQQQDEQAAADLAREDLLVEAR